MIELQRKLMGDAVRNTAFHDALKTLIKPGSSRVIDLGSGTGFLGFLASRMGAKSVTCIESGEIAETSRRLAKRNAIKNLTIIQRHSTQLKDLPRADLLVSETLGNYALEENIIESIEDAKRFMEPGGIIMPSRIRQYVCPITNDRLQREIDIWNAGFNLDFTEAREISLHNMYVKTVQNNDLLHTNDAIRAFDCIDFSKKNQSRRTATEVWTTASPLTMYGFALWWEAELAPGITLSTSPLAVPTHWEQIYLPLLSPISLKKDESVEWHFTSDTRWKVKVNLTWKATHRNAAQAIVSSQELDMRKGFL